MIIMSVGINGTSEKASTHNEKMKWKKDFSSCVVHCEREFFFLVNWWRRKKKIDEYLTSNNNHSPVELSWWVEERKTRSEKQIFHSNLTGESKGTSTQHSLMFIHKIFLYCTLFCVWWGWNITSESRKKLKREQKPHKTLCCTKKNLFF